MENETRTEEKFLVKFATALIGAIILPVGSLLFATRGCNNYMDKIATKSVKEMLSSGKVLTISAEDYCKMKGKRLEDYACFEFSSSLNPWINEDGSLRLYSKDNGSFKSKIPKDAEIVVEFYRDGFRYLNNPLQPSPTNLSYNPEGRISSKRWRGQCGYGTALTSKKNIEEPNYLLSSPNISPPAMW